MGRHFLASFQEMLKPRRIRLPRIRDQMISRSWFLLNPGGTVLWPLVYLNVGERWQVLPILVNTKTPSMFSLFESFPKEMIRGASLEMGLTGVLEITRLCSEELKIFHCNSKPDLDSLEFLLGYEESSVSRLR